MENTNNLSNSILQPSEPSILSSSTNLSGESNTGFFDFLTNINLTTWLIIVLILAFLGFNIFLYLAKGTEDIANFFKPLIEKIFGTALEVTGKTVDVPAEGAKEVVSGTANVVNAGLTSVQDIIPTTANSSIHSEKYQETIQKPDVTSKNTLNRALDSSHRKSSDDDDDDYEAHEASSSILKSGWCYIGEDRGFRSCAQVGVDDKCMSGDIFPSQEICVNPNLRM